MKKNVFILGFFSLFFAFALQAQQRFHWGPVVSFQASGVNSSLSRENPDNNWAGEQLERKRLQGGLGVFASYDLLKFLNFAAELNLKQWGQKEEDNSRGVLFSNGLEYVYTSQRSYSFSSLNLPLTANFIFPLFKQQFFIGGGSSLNYMLGGVEKNSYQYRSAGETELFQDKDPLFDGEGFTQPRRFSAFLLGNIGMRVGNSFELLLRYERMFNPFVTQEVFLPGYWCGTQSMKDYRLSGTSLSFRWLIR